MPYNTIDDVLGKIPGETLLQLVNDSDSNLTIDMVRLALSGSDLSALDTGEQQAAVAAADAITRELLLTSAQVDGYCSNLYDVPFDTPPPFLKSLDLDLAVYNIFSRRENVPENREKRYNNAVKALAAISRGDIQLGVSGPAAPEQKGQTIAVSTPPAGIFTMERLRNF